MTVEVLKSFKAKCGGQIVQHNPGERLQIKIKVVPSLVKGGFVRLLEPLDKAKEPLAVKIFSKILNETVWVVTHPEAIPFVPDGEIYYLPEEIRNLKGATPDEIRQIHMIKKSIGGKLVVVKDRNG